MVTEAFGIHSFTQETLKKNTLSCEQESGPCPCGNPDNEQRLKQYIIKNGVC